jgi:hypothetical protein
VVIVVLLVVVVVVVVVFPSGVCPHNRGGPQGRQ